MDLTNIDNDMTPEELESLRDFLAKGKPGFANMLDTDVFKCINLYMSGKSYGEIAKITNVKKDVILYTAVKTDWYNKRLNHYQDITDTMLDKLKRTKIDSINTVQTMIAALGKYYGDQFNEYLANNDVSIIEDMDTKMLAQYYKSIESLSKIIGEAGSSGKNKKPSVNVNVGSTASIKELEDGSVEITDESAANLLKDLAEYTKKNKS